MNRGFLVGKFAPLHNGHIEFIYQAASKVDELIVILSHDQKWVDKQDRNIRSKLDWRIRMRWLLDVFKDETHIKIHMVDESNIPSYPNGWEEWSKIIKKEVLSKYQDVSYVFSSEPTYEEHFSKYFPECKHVIIDSERSVVNISATQIREDVLDHWSHIPSVVRKNFAKKVCVIGTESTGKSTLVRYLAKHFSTSWTEEYGRTYVEQYCHGNENLLVPSDFHKIAIEQKRLEDLAASTANKVVFCDTNALITQYYHSLMYGYHDDIVENIIRNEMHSYDLFIFLRNTVPWVDDGVRLHPDPEGDNEFKLESMVEQYIGNQVKVVFINDKCYNDRMNKSVNEVMRLLGY